MGESRQKWGRKELLMSFEIQSVSTFQKLQIDLTIDFLPRVATRHKWHFFCFLFLLRFCLYVTITLRDDSLTYFFGVQFLSSFSLMQCRREQQQRTNPTGEIALLHDCFYAQILWFPRLRVAQTVGLLKKWGPH